MYFDEDLLLDLRLHSLDKFVKKFVITEATYTHNGSKKELNFDINNFKKFKDKIIYIVVDKQPENILDLKDNDDKGKKGEKLILNGMARDYFQRENLSKGLIDAVDQDLILISDLDEIPNLQETTEYIFQYYIDGDIKVGDPYAEKVSDPWNDHYITNATCTYTS